MASSSTLTSALQKLSAYRSTNSRNSQAIFSNGQVLLKSGKANSLLGAEAWDFLEQLALASLDIGRIDVADECILLLERKFPKSPRVDILHGIRLESTDHAEALRYYREILDADPSQLPAWKRLITVLRAQGDNKHAVDELVVFLDTVYTDVEAWGELADIYAMCSQYDKALQALSHMVLLAPQNPFYLLQAGETAYTAGDVQLALKYYLGVLDMLSLDSVSQEGCLAIRAWYGIKLCTRRLLNQTIINSIVEKEHHTSKHQLLSLDGLAGERLSMAYLNQADMKTALLKWLAAS